MRSAKFWAFKSRSSKRETEDDLDWDLGSLSTPPLSLSLLFLALLPCSYCNALLCVMLSAVNCASSIWLTNIARLLQFECPDFHLIFCNVIYLFLFFFISSYPGISLEVFQVATVFLLRHLLVRVVSTRTTRAPASTWVNIFLSFSLVCLPVFFFFPPFHLLQWTLVWLTSRSSLTSCTVSFVFPSVLRFPGDFWSQPCEVRLCCRYWIFFLFSFLYFFLVCSPSDRIVNTEWSFFIPKDLVIRVLFFLYLLYFFFPQILLLYSLHPCLSSPMPISWYWSGGQGQV